MTAENRRWPISRRTFDVIAGVILAVVLLVSLQAVPRVPRSILILASEPGEGYHEYGERYAAYLRDKGLKAEVVETAGSLENLKRLAAGGSAAVGFAQSGVEAELEGVRGLEDLRSLGSLAFEPVWLFARIEEQVVGVSDLEGLRLGLVPRGTGSRAMVELLLDENGLANRVEAVPLDLAPSEWAQALISGDVDALCLVGDPRSEVISQLIGHPGMAPVSFPRAAAYARRHRKLAELTVPRGTFDLTRDIPAHDLQLIASATNLVGRNDLHPAAVGLLLEAAREIHRPASLLAGEGVFPTTDHTSLPISSAAITYLQDGQGLTYRLLPFWMAGLLTWLAKLIMPFATVALFLYRILPGSFQLRFGWRVRHFFKRLERIEKARSAGTDVEQLRADLDRLDRDSVSISVPRGMASPYFEFRQAVHDMRDRLNG